MIMDKYQRNYDNDHIHIVVVKRPLNYDFN